MSVEKDKIFNEALNKLKEQTGLIVEYEENLSSQNPFDYKLKVEHPNIADKVLNFSINVKRKINNATLGEAAISAKFFPERSALAAEYVTPQQAENLRRLDITFFDTAGNAYLNEPGLYVFIKGNKTEVNKTNKTINLFNANGLKLLLHFLLQPGLENADYRTIEKETNVPRTTVGRIINDLERGGFLKRRVNRERFLTRKPELLRRWAEAYAEKLRIKLKPVRYRSAKQTGRWWKKINIEDYKAVWGGETGGAKLTNHLKPQTATVYADSSLPKLQAKYGLIKDEKGEFEILRKFWNFGEVGETAPPLVVYADLLATADERNLETAQIIYDKYLAQITKENS